jgi:hypothetical protein
LKRQKATKEVRFPHPDYTIFAQMLHHFWFQALPDSLTEL